MRRGKRILALLLSVLMGLSDHAWVNAVGIQTEPSGQGCQNSYGELLEQVTDLYEKKQLMPDTGQPDHSFATGVLLVGSNEPDFDRFGAELVIEASPGLYALSYPTPADAKAAYGTYSQMDGILFVEPDTVIGTQEEGSEAVAATEISEENENSVEADTQTSADALHGQTPACIAVVDTGIDVTMEKAQPYLTGYNREGILAKLRQFFGGEPDTEGFVSEAEVRDENGHGSQVTGLIADALAGDGIGGDQAEILPVKVAGADGRCTVLQLYLGIERAIALQSDLINVSMGAFATTESAVLTKAADDAAKAGITMVVSAGNNGSDVASYAPANIPSVITAGSIDRNSQASDFS
ncbi:MAG: S8 family serine peptidase, partial [Lachnospiraceae bacterium]|nr:S8 family serine peptidase [Lachnospiraceae bacterium]